MKSGKLVLGVLAVAAVSLTGCGERDDEAWSLSHVAPFANANFHTMEEEADHRVQETPRIVVAASLTPDGPTTRNDVLSAFKFTEGVQK